MHNSGFARILIVVVLAMIALNLIARCDIDRTEQQLHQTHTQENDDER